MFSSSIPVFNKDVSFYPGSQLLIGQRPPRGAAVDTGSQYLIGQRPTRSTTTGLGGSAIATTTGTGMTTGSLHDLALERMSQINPRQSRASSVAIPLTNSTEPVIPTTVRIPIRQDAGRSAFETVAVPTVRIPTSANRPLMASPLSVRTMGSGNVGARSR